MLRRVLDVLYPRSCAGCGSGPWPFCPTCAGLLVTFPAPRCGRCGMSVAVAVPSCRACPPEPVGTARAPFLFEGPARAAVLRLKFGGERDVAGALGRAAAVVAPTHADSIAWVPLSRARRRRRGFDQAELLARAVGRELGTPHRPLLTRVIDLPPQAKRSGAERRTALVGAFAAQGPVGGRILLVDDVLTTGATVAECATTLVRAGASGVDVLTAARTGLLSSNRLRSGSVVARGNLPR